MEKMSILHFVINIVYTCTVYLMVTTFHEKESKYDKKTQFFSYLIFYFIITSVYSIFNIPILTILVNIVGLIALSFLYDNRIFKNLQISIVIYSILAMEDIALTFLTNNKLLNILQNREHLSIITIFLGNIIFLSTAVFLKNVLKTRILKKQLLLVSLFSTVISLITIAIAFILITKAEIKIEFFLIIIVMLLLINLFSVWGYEQLNISFKELIKAQLLKEKTQAYEKQIKLMDETVKTAMVYKHDEKNHMLALQGLLQGKEYKKAQEYLQDMLQIFIQGKNDIISKNQALNSLLNYYTKKMKESNINVQIDVLTKENIPISDYDLSVILGNMLMNALDAQIKLKVEERKVEIKVIDEKNKFYIQVNNTYDGKVIEENGKLLSTKDEKEKHGIGLHNIKETIEKYEGVFKIKYDEKKFICYVMLIR